MKEAPCNKYLIKSKKLY